MLGLRQKISQEDRITKLEGKVNGEKEIPEGHHHSLLKALPVHYLQAETQLTFTKKKSDRLHRHAS